MYDQLQQRNEAGWTFAEPGEASSFGQTLASVARAGPLTIAIELATKPDAYLDLFRAAERNTTMVDTITSRAAAHEEAYDRRIKAIREATGVELENPLRNGYGGEARDRVRAGLVGQMTADDVAKVPETMRAIFEERLADLRGKHPDKADALAFGNIGEEAQAIAKGAESDYEAARKNPKLDPLTGLATEFAGGMWGQRRDPLFVGSLFFGPTSAMGKQAVTRVATSALFQGFYNAGIAALEQPEVQAWRQEVGLRSGVLPAIENVGMAFLFGAIPGAAFRAIHEASRAAVRRTLSGAPERGDAETAVKAVGGEMAPENVAAVHMGEEMADADRITAPPKPKEVATKLHDDLTTAAQRHADDPIGQPSPEAVEMMAKPEPDPEIAARVAEAQPRNLHEAQMAATEALEEQGNRATVAATREAMDVDRLPPVTPEERPKPAAGSKDPLDKIPFVDAKGEPTLVSARSIARQAERETQMAELVRACK